MSVGGAAKGVVHGIGTLIKVGILIVVIVVVVAAIGLGKSATDSQKKSDAVTAKIGQVSMGMSKDQVISILGTPEDQQHFESQFMGQQSTNDCIYYGSLSSTSYQFCFDNGKLTSKNSY